MRITKTDFLDYSFCRKNLWLKKHKPELFSGLELSDFEKKIIEEGNLVDVEARYLFPGGKLVTGEGDLALAQTKALLEKKTKVIFQATFSFDVFFLKTDILEYNQADGSFNLYEVKATTKIKTKMGESHIYDLAFQKNIIEKTGLKIKETGVIHLNNKYRKEGEIDYQALFIKEDVSKSVLEIEPEVELLVEQVKEYLLSDEEERGCPCLYRGRSNQCTTFAYSNPQVPEYSVHDINRIGNSTKLLQEWIDMGVYKIEDIPNPEVLERAKLWQYQAYMDKKAIVDKTQIEEVLAELEYPLYFFDYEGFVSAIPKFDGFGPYEQIPFQYSLHIMSQSGKLEHREFLITEAKPDITKPLVERIRQDIDTEGTVIAWNVTYEKQRNEKLAELHPQYVQFFNEINRKMFDLITIFTQGYYVDAEFRGKTSIKNVLPVLVPELSYKDLNIAKGDQASERWEKMISGELSLAQQEQIRDDLLEYCKLDTLAMVKIFQFLQRL